MRRRARIKLPVNLKVLTDKIRSSTWWGHSTSLADEIERLWPDILAIHAETTEHRNENGDGHYYQFVHLLGNLLSGWSAAHHLSPYNVAASLCDLYGKFPSEPE